MKKALALILALVMVFALCACGTAAETPAAPEIPAETETPTDGELPWAGHTLYVANWQGYNSDEDYCEKAFEDMTGAQVEHVYFNSYDELMTTLMTGGNKTIDAVVLSNNYTQWFHDEGLLANVDPAKWPMFTRTSAPTLWMTRATSSRSPGATAPLLSPTTPTRSILSSSTGPIFSILR